MKPMDEKVQWLWREEGAVVGSAISEDGRKWCGSWDWAVKMKEDSQKFMTF